MNERIKQLYKEAVNSVSAELHNWNKNWQPGNPNFEYEKVLYEKFAKLIVRQCADITDSIGEHGYIASEEMLEQFGVK